jgi:hypothetical protein
MAPVFLEVTRSFGSEPPASAGRELVLLPLVGEAEVLAFLRTVPAGSDVRKLPTLAAAYGEAHLGPRKVADSEDDEAAG